MHNKFISWVKANALLLFCIIPATVFSQVSEISPMTITSPALSAVYQRDVKGERTITVTGTFNVPMDKIEVRAVPVIDWQGISTGWLPLQTAPKGGVFEGNITIHGGWYTIEVRGTANGNVVGRGVVQRVGIGEVFLISGQSNAQGLKKYLGSADNDPPGAEDERVVYVSNYENDSEGMYNDLLTDPPAPQFAQIKRGLKTMSPRGQTAWCWGILGDILVKKLNLPVLFINTAWEGSSIINWYESSKGQLTVSKYDYPYPKGMPYANLRIAARNYANQYGVRAILWMHGETDGLYNTPRSVYRDNLQAVITTLESEIGKRLTWVITRTSRTAPNGSLISATYPVIVAAQNDVLAIPFNPTWAGPETDGLVPDRPIDGIHFIGKESLTILANAWADKLDANFFSTVTPAAPAAIPTLTAACVSTNNAVTISLPEGYSSYTWNTGATGNSITVSTPGTYRATVKDNFGNSILSSVVVLEKNARPDLPIITQQGTQQACADSSFQFSVTDDGNIYSWYKKDSDAVVATGIAAKISESGNYYVKAQNIFGCVSGNSADASLIIRPKISKPIIESSGPFSITASIEEEGLNEKFLWRRPGIEADTTADMIKILKTGVYSARAVVTYKIEGNSNLLTCYSDTASREFRTNESNEVVIYPNPSQGNYIYVESRDNITDAKITLYDIFGTVIKTTAPQLLNSRLELNVRNLPTGKYILRVTGKDQSLTKQIVVR
ncbi:T9SS type A sorting domain-containing protein [Dyadobacter sp. NIV53]|uniref:T9SS type A sorting domain-containing protein n=1 Tax=Dyadobacter sp. NIV53 TaxID=2861765 RepID=UPI001C86F0B0|nr:T9SS type A sorting domain-containing protein [Dyadobacter sp. NIV53]